MNRQHRYRPHGLYDAKPNPARCAAAVHDAGRGCGFHQCSRKPVDGEWCNLHSEAGEEKRAAELARRSRERYENDPHIRAIHWINLLEKAVVELATNLHDASHGDSHHGPYTILERHGLERLEPRIPRAIKPHREDPK